jgi:hypothetical protein
VFFHTRQNPGANWILLRDTWENMRDTTQQEFFKWFPDGVFGRYVASTKQFTWTLPEMKGGSVTFLGMDDEKDAGKLQSREIAGVGMDEPSPAAGTGGISEMILTTALTRLRQPKMRYYAVRLAQNNPDETHWTYKRFVEPGMSGYVHLQTAAPENLTNLPPDYYKDMERDLAGREDLKRRFVKGEFGFQKLGKDVTPNWSDKIHLVTNLEPIPNQELVLLWDFGLNATCIITQVTSLGHWNILESHVLDDGGTYQLIEDHIKPILVERYPGYKWRHIGDPAGKQREQSDSNQSAVKVIKRELGGKWTDGEQDINSRINPLNAVLSKTLGGTGMVQVDKQRAKHVWHALRGGWHYKVHSGGVTSANPLKNDHSHPGDAMGYGAAKLFPLGRLRSRSFGAYRKPGSATFFGNSQFIGRKVSIPKESHTIGE